MNEETLIEDAKQALLEYGWSKQWLIDSQTKALCALGSIYQAAEPTFVSKFGQILMDRNVFASVQASAPFRYIVDAIWDNYEDRVWPTSMSPSDRADLRPITVITLFNDHPDTTLDEVLAVFEKAEARRQETV